MLNFIKDFTSDIVHLKKDDIILAAYPKTGSTWIRFFFCNLISLEEWNGIDVDFNLLNTTMFSFGNGNLRKDWQHFIPRLIKTHMNFNPVFRKNKIILLIRDPRDIMLSHYHFLKARKKPIFHFKDTIKKRNYDDTFTNFIIHPKCGLQNFFQHFNSWIAKANIVIKYENLKINPLEEFSCLLSAIGLNEIDLKLVRASIEKSDIQCVRKYDNKKGHKDYTNSYYETSKFTRDGSIEQWKKIFSDKQLQIYEFYKNQYDFSYY